MQQLTKNQREERWNADKILDEYVVEHGFDSFDSPEFRVWLKENKVDIWNSELEAE